MKRIFSLFLTIIIICSALSISSISAVADESKTNNNVGSMLDRIKSDFDLVWNDEFDGDTLDSSKWQYDGDTVDRNSEAQMYANSVDEGNVYMENGNVVLKAKKEDAINADGKTRKYTSGEISTKGKACFKYGYFEFRAKIPYGNNTFPAIWLLGYDYKTGATDWPHSGEIDVFESLGGVTTWSTLHYSKFGKYDRASHLSTGAGTYQNSDKHPMHDEYHNFWLYWTDEFIVIGCDESWFNVIDIRANNELAQAFRIYEHYILFDLAMGPYGNKITESEDDDWRFYIDYARVYQPKDNSDYDNYKIIEAENTNSDVNSAKRYSLNSATSLVNSKTSYINSNFDDFKAGTYDIYAAYTAQTAAKKGTYDVKINDNKIGTLVNSLDNSQEAIESTYLGKIKLTEDNLPFELKFDYSAGTKNNLAIDKYFFVKTNDGTGAFEVNQDTKKQIKKEITVSNETELDSAVKEINKGGTIKLNNNITLTNKKTWQKCFTLDLNSKTLNLNSNASINVSITNEVNVKNGTLATDSSIMVCSEADNFKATFDNVIFNISRTATSTNDTLFRDWYRSGDWNIKNCTFNFTSTSGDKDKTLYLCGSDTSTNKIKLYNTTINGSGYQAVMRIKEKANLEMYNCTLNNCQYAFKSDSNSISSASIIIANTSLSGCDSITNYENNMKFVKLADNNTTDKTLSFDLTDASITCSHSYSDATCTTPKTCKYCLITEGQSLGSHQAGTPEITASTCYDYGKKVIKCTICNEVLSTEKIELKNHDFKLTNTYEASCALPGGAYKEYKCLLCGTVQTRSYNQDGKFIKTAHTPDLAKRVVKDFSCAEGGKITDYCTVCNQTYVSERMRGGHRFDDDKTVIVKKTCVQNGYIQKHCKTCEQTLIFDEQAATGHNFVDGVCQNCGQSESSQLEVNCSMVFGASIRLGNVNGIRFYTTVDKTKIAELKNQGATVEMGTLIAPEDLIDENGLTFESKKFIDVQYKADDYYTENDFTGIVGSIVNIKENNTDFSLYSGNITRAFVGRGYVKVTKNGETVITYAEYADSDISNNSRSLKYVSEVLRNDSNSSKIYNTYKDLIDKWADATLKKFDKTTDPFENDIW